MPIVNLSAAPPPIQAAHEQLHQALKRELAAVELRDYALAIVAEFRERYALHDAVLIDLPRSSTSRDFTFGAPSMIKREHTEAAGPTPPAATAPSSSKRSLPSPTASELASSSSSPSSRHRHHPVPVAKVKREQTPLQRPQDAESTAPQTYLSPFGSALSDPMSLPAVNPTVSYVSQLNELCQKKRIPLPKFDTTSVKFFLGPAGLKHFASVTLQGHTFLSFSPPDPASTPLTSSSLASTTLRLEDGSATKKVAKEMAAKEALYAIYRLAQPPE